jgi:hypothetical protein
VNFSKDDDYEFSFDELVRTFHGAPLFEKPEIGNNPFTPVSETPPEKTGDPIRKIMKHIVGDFENGDDYTIYKNLVQAVDMSRIMLDIIINEAVQKGYIALDRDGDIRLQPEGKKYAIQHKLVNA